MRLLLLFLLIIPSFLFAKEIDLLNHSNDHGVIFYNIDRRSDYKLILSHKLRSNKCDKASSLILDPIVNSLRPELRHFWSFKNCIDTTYTYDTNDIELAYHNYRFDIYKIINQFEEARHNNIAGYMPSNIQKGVDIAYFLGMRNKLITWKNDNKQLTFSLPIHHCALIAIFTQKQGKIEIREILLYLRD